jgi:hypothetical protein
MLKASKSVRLEISTTSPVVEAAYIGTPPSGVTVTMQLGAGVEGSSLQMKK